MIAQLDGSGNLVQSYTWGNDLSGSIEGAGGIGGLLMIKDVPSNSSYFVGHDGNGNITMLVNAETNELSAEYEYSPFGEVLRKTGPAANLNPFRFSSKWQDPKTGYLYYGYRWYDPVTGRWLSRDPLNDLSFLTDYAQNHPFADVDSLFEESFKSPYLFVSNDPINSVDVNGLIEVAGGDLSNTSIHGIWESGPNPSVSDVSRTGFAGPKLNPGGNLGIGIIGINYKLTGTVKGKIRCSKECPLGKDFVKTLNEWHLDLTVNVSVPLTTGIGITQKYVNYGYNIPHKLIGVSKGIQKYSKMQEILKAIAEDKLAPDALCNLHQKDLSLTLDISLEK